MALQSKLIIFISLLSFWHLGCGEKALPQHHEIVFLIDITDPNESAIPNPNAITSQIQNMLKNQNDQLTAQFGFFDDLSGGQLDKLEIPKADVSIMTANEVKRKNDIKKLFDSFEATISQKISQTQVNKDFSKLYAKICKQLGVLSKTTADSKTLVLYTDLLENSEMANFYSISNLNGDESNVRKIYEEKFKASCALPDLTGIHIKMMVYRTPNNDTKIKNAELFWQQLFTQNGATVSIDQ